MNIKLPVNPEEVVINKAYFDYITRSPTPLFQQQLCAAGIILSMPTVTSGLDNTAIAPPTFDVSLVISSRFFENCSSNPIQAMPLHVLPILQPITTLTTVASQQLTAPISIHNSLATQIFPTSELVVSVGSLGTVLYCNSSFQTAPFSTGITTTSCQQSPLSMIAPPFMPILGQAVPVAPASLTVQDLSQLIAASKKGHLPEWKLSHNNGDPLQWHEWFPRFKVPLTLHLLRTLSNYCT